MQKTRRMLSANVLLCLALIAAGPVAGQKTTEQYIPIGQSPGASDRYSYIGTIVASDLDAMTITIEDSKGRHVVRVTDTTRIWLDRSKRRQPNLTGSYEDCEVGRRAEVMHLRDDSKTAAWIKVEQT